VPCANYRRRLSSIYDGGADDRQVVRKGYLLSEGVDALASAAGGLYDRIMGRDLADRSCRYLFARQEVFPCP
jgi:hypothetical protein